MHSLSPHTKKLIGTLFVLLWLLFYILIAMGVGVLLLPHASWLEKVLYYLLAGTLWIIPVGLLLPWMYRKPAKK
jgi:hypothetical protein